MDTPTFQVDDLVMIADDFARPADRGVIYRVTRMLKVSLELEPVAGGRRVRAHPQVLVPAPSETDPKAAPRIGVPHQRRPVPLRPGQIVTVAGPGWRKPAGQLYVVLKHRQDDKVNMAKLGGEASGRYWPSVPRRMLTVVEPDQVIRPISGS
jgi:hypothetical protein